MTRLHLGPNPAILVVVLQRLGDVLLTTPLIRSLRREWPDARIDVLVFAGTEGVLAGNPDIDTVMTMPERMRRTATLAMAHRLRKRYDLALSTQQGDRPVFFAARAGRISVGPVGEGRNGAIKRFFLTYSIEADPERHRVDEVLRLADAIGIPRVAEVVCPAGNVSADDLPTRDYAVIHAAPKFRYKRWTTDGWRALATELAGRNLEIVVTGGPDPAERRYLDDIWRSADVPLRRFDGRLDWPGLARLIAGAQVFVGPDTVVTHLAAATGCPTVALFGPTDPRLWGPWPAGGLALPWKAAGRRQCRGNVLLVQNPLPCLPCQNEGCERHLESYSRCLDELAVTDVVGAVDVALAELRPER